jgi:glycosyltransferase involved in cell wall biosynthesis
VTSPAYVVVQTGARRSYAVPEILAGAGMLDRFYTDACASSGIGRASAWLRHLPIVGSTFQRLQNRQLPASIVTKTRTFDFSALQSAIASWQVRDDQEAKFRLDLRRGDRLGRAMMRAGFGNATHVYCMLNEAGPYLKEAKQRGLTVVSEVYILLATEAILAVERKAFPKWEPAAPDCYALRQELCPENEMLEYSDYFICPSPAVRADLTTNWGIESAKTAIVPYGINSEWLRITPQPVPRRVLFVGTAELRKGIHYFAMAATKLKSRGYAYDYIVAGNVSAQIAARAECQCLNFLGRVPRDKICDQYASADVFVLPSLAEGSAESIYEAMACGLPIITTGAAGSVVRHGVEGLIVPERDPDALAEAISQIVDDRELRARMATAARERASQYTWDHYGGRLLSALGSIPNTASRNEQGSWLSVRSPSAVPPGLTKLRVLVAQNGARRNYAVPTVLAKSGLLEAFYTDACGNVGLGRFLAAGRYLPLIAPSLNRLFQRQIPAGIVPQTTAFSISSLADGATEWLSGGLPTDSNTGREMLRRGLGNANLVYSFMGWGRPLLEAAKSRGIPVVTDFYTRPSLFQISRDERRAHPGWEPEEASAALENNVGTSKDPCSLSDYLIVADESVADDVVAIHGFPRDRISVVPLGVDDSFFHITPQPVPGRVLFSGTCCLWKGFHYFAMATEILAAREHQYEFLAAGDVSPTIRSRPSCGNITFLNRVPRIEMQKAYETADVLAFPTLADSFGMVQLEAIAVGVPVVTTRTAGSVIRHGIDGFIVPERDPQALADAITEIVENRDLRARMSIAARERARDFSRDRYGERLIGALQRVTRS